MHHLALGTHSIDKTFPTPFSDQNHNRGVAVVDLQPLLVVQNWWKSKLWRHQGTRNVISGAQSFWRMPLIFRLVTRWCFFFFIFLIFTHPLPVEVIRFDTYFSNGSKPPTSFDILWSWSPNSCLWKASVGLVTQHYVRLPGFDMAGTEHGAKGYLHWVVKCHGTWKKHQRVFRIQLLSLWMCWILQVLAGILFAYLSRTDWASQFNTIVTIPALYQFSSSAHEPIAAWMSEG